MLAIRARRRTHFSARHEAHQVVFFAENWACPFTFPVKAWAIWETGNDCIKRHQGAKSEPPIVSVDIPLFGVRTCDTADGIPGENAFTTRGRPCRLVGTGSPVAYRFSQRMNTPHGSPARPDLEQHIAQLEARLAALQEQLCLSQKMSALGELVGTTTHEFNNVLMTILNYAKLGLRHGDAPTRTKAFEKILAAGQRAAKITNSVLGMARNRSHDLEPTDLRALVDETLILLERELQKYRIQVELELPEVPWAQACGNQIQQILINLMTNARQAMAAGGRLVVRLAHDRQQQTVDLSIRDTGPGISADQLPKIFEPYYSTKSGPDETGKGGTGLGLSVCRQIIERHRGKIRVESTVGVGTCFTIKLPVAAAAPGSPILSLPQNSLPHPSGQTPTASAG